MTSIKLFLKFLAVSYQKFLREFSEYAGSYSAFLIIGALACVPWEGLGYESNSFYEVMLQIIVGILSLIVIVNVVLIEKAKHKMVEKEQLAYAAPTYLIYTLYSSLIILAGLFCFIVPGIIAAIFVGMVPLASVLIDNDSVNYFKLSFRMARKDPLMIISFGLASLLIELPSFAFDLIPDWKIRLVSSVVYCFLEAALLTILTITSVRVFYYLKAALNDQSQ